MGIHKIEKSILRYWAKTRAFEKSIANRKNAKHFIFYEGPPTANGMPGIHHVLARVFKDAICRYKTMQGYRVERKAGWDTHGLPVELEVEKELGLKRKGDIEKFGIAKFNARCKNSIWKYKKNWEDLTRTIGFWLDMDRPYITYETEYMETVWWILKRIWEKKLLYKDYKVVPFCPRCETALSSHEVALGYKNIKEPSIYIKFKIKNEKLKTTNQNSKFTRRYALNDNMYLLVWTTTPWTLPGNVAVAVNPNFTYLLVKQNRDVLILAKERLSVLDGEYKVLREVAGRELLDVEYEPLFSFLPLEKRAHRVIGGDFVSLQEGTGLVHIAPAFGEEDMGAGKKNDLPILMTVEENGAFREEVTPWAGMFVKDADPKITEDLESRRLLYKTELYAHDYPFCWRCDSPLLYYAKESWFIRMSSVKQSLIRHNRNINWIPPHLRDGRFGEWLRELKDWALSRQRYWGTPLPIWVCDECGKEEAIGSVRDLAVQTYSSNRYYILRHAESESNVRGIVSCTPKGDTFHLTSKGRKQAHAAAKDLQKRNIDIIYASDLVRTRETAEIISRELGVSFRLEPGLREYNLGIFNQRSITEFEAALSVSQRFERAPEGGETWNEVKTRMLFTLSHIDSKHKNKTILIVSHGDPLWLLEGALRGMSREELLTFKEHHYIEKAEMRNIRYSRLPYTRKGEIDLHRPYIDDVTFACEKCGGSMRRVPDLIDVWFDSGAMPFAQNPEGFRAKIKKRTDEFLFPADYICEAMDQTRGWFYTLLAISTLLGLDPPYKNVISVGWVLDKHGKKMSKSRGNIVNPWEIVEKYGADALRWYFYTVNQPGEPKLFDEADVRTRFQKFIMTYWNTFLFFETYVSRGVNLRMRRDAVKSETVLDKWVLARFDETLTNVTTSLDMYDLVGSAREIEAFVEDLSNWYVRRSRRRFQKPRTPREREETARVLGYVLYEFTKLSAPFVPFVAEACYAKLKRYSALPLRESVHLEDWPAAKPGARDRKILEGMQKVRQLVTLGLKARREAGIKVRQPLSRALVGEELGAEFEDILKDELNVKRVEVSRSKSSRPGEDTVFAEERGLRIGIHTTLNTELKEEGTVREIIRMLQDMRKDAGYRPTQNISVFWAGERHARDLMKRWRDTIRFEVGARALGERDPDHHVFDVERETVLDGQRLWFGITRG